MWHRGHAEHDWAGRRPHVRFGFFTPASAHSARTCLCLRSDHSNADHGGYVLVDDDGRLYVDVVLHNKAPASGSPIDDPLSALERSAAYFV